MLDKNMQGQLQAHMDKIAHPIELVASLDDGDKSRELAELLETIASLSDRITLRRDGADERKPSFAIVRSGSDVRVDFAGIPLGHEFTSLVLALLQVGGHPPRIDAETVERIRGIEGDYHFRTYLSLSCQNCPETVQSLNLISILNPHIKHVAIDGAVFPEEVERHEIMSVPAVLLDGEAFDQGRMTVEQIVARLDARSPEQEAETMRAKDPFDVLVVGGGPGGAAAAIYAARKGIRTGLVAERFGGQVLDTLAIENFISVNYTEGPKLSAALEAHVHDYDVDVMDLQRATRLVPADRSGDGHVQVILENGAALKARTVIVATGARWRQLGVPGEAEYRNKGVVYCPHCDGPLYKDKPVAIIGGGNSGAEAAIDLAGIAREVTLIEYEHELRADDVLQRRLRQLGNVRIVTGAQTTEVLGDGRKVTGLQYRDRDSDGPRELAVEGVFVQIGLLPNTEWLADRMELSERGEIVIDARGATSLPGVFAAGDATTVAYKQIVVAMGAGSTASLSAFDHLIRARADAEEASPAAVA